MNIPNFLKDILSSVGLEPKNAESVNYYTSEYTRCENVNKFLAGKFCALDESYAFHDGVKNAIELSKTMQPRKKGITTYRGADSGNFKDIINLSEQEIVGQEIPIRAFSSSSTSKDVAGRFSRENSSSKNAQRLILQFDIERGRHSYDVKYGFDNVSRQIAHEKETILPPAVYEIVGARRVQSFEGYNGNYLILQMRQKELLDIKDLINMNLDALQVNIEEENEKGNHFNLTTQDIEEVRAKINPKLHAIKDREI